MLLVGRIILYSFLLLPIGYQISLPLFCGEDSTVCYFCIFGGFIGGFIYLCTWSWGKKMWKDRDGPLKISFEYFKDECPACPILSPFSFSPDFRPHICRIPCFGWYECCDDGERNPSLRIARKYGTFLLKLASIIDAKTCGFLIRGISKIHASSTGSTFLRSASVAKFDHNPCFRSSIKHPLKDGEDPVPIWVHWDEHIPLPLNL